MWTTLETKGWKVGDAVRTYEGAYSTATILGFESQGDRWYAKLARPYVYAHDIGTSCAGPLTGLEIYGANIESLQAAERSDRDGTVRNYSIASDFVLEHR